MEIKKNWRLSKQLRIWMLPLSLGERICILKL